MFANEVEKLIRRLQKDAKQSALTYYKAEQQRRFDLYVGCYKPYVYEWLKEVCPTTWQEFKPAYLPVYRKVIDKRAGGLYRKPPARTFTGPDGAPVNDNLKRMLEDAYRPKYVNKVMDKAARYLESHRTILLVVVWRHNRVELDVLPPPLFHIVQGYPDPTTLEDAEALILFNRTRCSTPEKADEDTRTIWQSHADDAVPAGGPPQYYVVDDNSKVIEQGDNPYRVPVDDGATGDAMQWEWVYPAVLLQAEDPDGEIYLSGGDELTDAALTVAFALTDHFFIERYQGFGQPVFWGVTNAADMTLSPNVAIKLGDKTQQDFDFRAPPGSSVDRLEGIRKFLTMLATAEDIPASTFDESSTPPSGISRRIATADLIEHREVLAGRLAEYEAEIFEKVRAVWNAHSAQVKRVPWNIDLTVTPAPQAVPIDPMEEDARTEKRASIGLDSIVDKIVDERGITREDASIMLTRNRQENGTASNDTYPVIAQQEKLMLAGVLSPVDLIMAMRNVDRPQAEVILAQNRADMAGSALLAQAGGSTAAAVRAADGAGTPAGAPQTPAAPPVAPRPGSLAERVKARMAAGTPSGAGGQG